jgi:hypothetical protein
MRHDYRFYIFISIFPFLLVIILLLGIIFSEEPKPELSIQTLIGMALMLLIPIVLGIVFLRQGFQKKKLFNNTMGMDNEQIIQRNSEIKRELERCRYSKSKSIFDFNMIRLFREQLLLESIMNVRRIKPEDRKI